MGSIKTQEEVLTLDGFRGDPAKHRFPLFKKKQRGFWEAMFAQVRWLLLAPEVVRLVGAQVVASRQQVARDHGSLRALGMLHEAQAA